MLTIQDLEKYKTLNARALYSNIEIEYIDLVRKILKENNLKTKVLFRGKNRRRDAYTKSALNCLRKDATTFSVYDAKTFAQKEYENTKKEQDEKRAKLKTEVSYLTHEIYELILNSNYSHECSQFVLSRINALQYEI
jgi:hypothetical protein